MARKRYAIPQYGTVIMAGKEYYRTRIEDADGKRVALYGRTREELYDKVLEAREQIEDNTFRRSSPTVKGVLRKVAVVTIRTGKSHYVDGLHIESKPAYYKASGSYEYSRCYSG